MKPYNVFVYGTLRDPGGNGRILENSEKVCDAQLNGYKMYSCGGFPAIVETEDVSDIVVGEVFRVSDEVTRQRLDNLEGYSREADADNRFYDLDDVTVCSEDVAYDAEVYVFRDASRFTDENIITTGDWHGRR